MAIPANELSLDLQVTTSHIDLDENGQVVSIIFDYGLVAKASFLR